MYRVLDMVQANKKINDYLPEGTKGVIHQIYLNNPNVYLIEFVDTNNDTICIIDVSEIDIDPIFHK